MHNTMKITLSVIMLTNGIFSTLPAYAVDGVVYDSTLTYKTFNYPGTSSGAFFTGIRGDTVTGDYTLFDSGGDTAGILYSQLHDTWTNFPEDVPPVNLSGASSNTSYSANWGTYGNTLISVGTYKDPSYSTIYDLSYIYNANTPSSPITYLDVPANLKGDGDASATLFTFVHSISGNFIVGDYDTELATGNAFIYNLSETTGSSPVAAGTYQPLNVPGSVSTTAYGVYGHYVAGGFAKSTDVNIEEAGLNHGFISKIDADGKMLSSLQLDHPRAFVTHFEGITGGGKAGHFNLVTDYIDSAGVQHASYAHVVWDGVNDLTHPNNSVKWFDYAVPGATVTSANSGYQSTVVGIYEDGGSFAYLGTVGNVTENGITHLIYDPFANNAGTIATTGNNENGIDASVFTIYGNEYNDVINSGTITTSGTVAHGIISSGFGVITNTGTIAASGNQSNAVRLISNYSTLLNYGTIAGDYTATNAPDERNYTIRALIAPGASITNFSSGVISYNGLEGAAILLDESSGSFVDNQGRITATGDDSVGILAIATTDNTGIGNSGTIQAVGANAAGIWSEHDTMNINNSGNIIATTTGVSLGQNSNLNNSGLIQVTDSAGAAIRAAGDNNTINLNKGSTILGAIASTGTGNALNVNLGLRSAQSYAYNTSGDWNFTDADSGTRPAAFAASIGAASAGIGVQETAGEMLYEHTSAINQSLTRHALNLGGNEAGKDVWVDPYYSRNTRDASATNPDINKFSNDTFGVTAGFKTPVEVTRVDAIANLQTSELNIQDSSQKVSANSLMLGLSTPTLYQFHGVVLSAKALAGYTAYDGDREVITNTTGAGSQEVTSDYSSYSGIIGSQLTRIFPLSELLSANIVTGVDLAVEKYNSHTESAYFAFDDRTLTQLTSHIEGGLEAKTADGKVAVFGRVGLANRRLLDGHQANYAINGVDVTFDGGKESDTYVTEQVGARYKLTPKADLLASFGAGQSLNDVTTLQGNVGVNIKF